MTDTPDSARWARVERLFSAALTMAPENRENFLKDECGQDRELFEEVLALLDSSDSSGEYLLDLASRAGAPRSPEEDLGRLAGKRLGPWRLVELIGRGGMGVVYLAERDDEQFRMRAALKILPLGMASEAQRRRFRSERQILARLNHPNIARILDGGVTDDGTPFYVMEHVEGTRIDAYCDEKRLSVEERLVLFEGVCQAVEHAHGNLIIHQDLKPENILVTREGRVKLLDFGIARILEAETERTGELTRVQGRGMTLPYASPEQVMGEPVSTASDVYALGIILYELLAGRHPYRHQLTGTAQAISVITETVPRPPSGVAADPPLPEDPSEPSPLDSEALATLRRTTPHRLKRTLAGDLDTIILMALRKEAGRRYASVSDLLSDLRNARLKRPVSARPDSLSYRASRFLLRNRVAASLSTVAVLLLLGLVVISFRSAATERAQARQIRQEAARAEAVTDFLVGLFQFTEGQDGTADTIRARTLVDRGARRILESLDDQPETRVQMLGALGEVYGNLGLPEEEAALLEEAVAIVRSQPGDEKNLAHQLWRLAEAYRANRDYELAQPLYQEALDLYEEVLQEPLERGQVLIGVAANEAGLGNPERALTMNAEGIRILREAEGAESLKALRAISDRGMMFRATEATDSAMALYRGLLPALREKGDSGQFLLATTLNNLGYLLRTQGDLDGARDTYREALPIEQNLDLPVRLLTLLGNLAAVEEHLGNLAEAEAILMERLAYAHETWPQGHWRVGGAEGALVVFHMRHGRPEQALLHSRQQLESYRAQIGEDHAWTNNARVSLGACLQDLDRFPEAEPYLLEGFDAFREYAGMDHPQTQQLVARLISLYEDWGRPAEAQRFRELLVQESEGTAERSGDH